VTLWLGYLSFFFLDLSQNTHLQKYVVKRNFIFAVSPKSGWNPQNLSFLVSGGNEISKGASQGKGVCVLQYMQTFQHFPPLHLPRHCIFRPDSLELGHKEQSSSVHGRFDAFFSLLPGWKQKELQKAQRWLQTVIKHLYQDFGVSLQTLDQNT